MEGVFQAAPSKRDEQLRYFKLQLSSLTLYGSDMPNYQKPVAVKASIVNDDRDQVAPSNIVNFTELIKMRHDPKVYLVNTQDVWIALKENHRLCVQLADSNIHSVITVSELLSKKAGENFFHSLNSGDSKSGIRIAFRGAA